jgi:hypothetical protein
MSPTNTRTRVATALLLVFFAAMLPPIVTVANTDALVAGQAFLYLWAAGWGLFGILVLVWAAAVDAFSITESQVPPELRRQDEVVTAVSEGGER